MLAAASAIFFIVSVTATISLVMRLHPHAPAYVATGSGLAWGRALMGLPFAIGVFLLIACLGLSGWVRSHRLGLGTSAVAVLGALLVALLFVG